jgi:hypothetical protein
MLITDCLVEVGASLMHVFMVHVDYRLRYKLMHGSCLLVHVYSSISHIDTLKVVPSFYFYFRVVGWGKDRWLYPPFSCSRRT